MVSKDNCVVFVELIQPEIYVYMCINYTMIKERTSCHFNKIMIYQNKTVRKTIKKLGNIICSIKTPFCPDWTGREILYSLAVSSNICEWVSERIKVSEVVDG